MSANEFHLLYTRHRSSGEPSKRQLTMMIRKIKTTFEGIIPIDVDYCVSLVPVPTRSTIVQINCHRSVMHVDIVNHVSSMTNRPTADFMHNHVIIGNVDVVATRSAIVKRSAAGNIVFSHFMVNHYFISVIHGIVFSIDYLRRVVAVDNDNVLHEVDTDVSIIQTYCSLQRNCFVYLKDRDLISVHIRGNELIKKVLRSKGPELQPIKNQVFQSLELLSDGRIAIGYVVDILPSSDKSIAIENKILIIDERYPKIPLSWSDSVIGLRHMHRIVPLRWHSMKCDLIMVHCAQSYASLLVCTKSCLVTLSSFHTDPAQGNDTMIWTESKKHLKILLLTSRSLHVLSIKF